MSQTISQAGVTVLADAGEVRASRLGALALISEALAPVDAVEVTRAGAVVLADAGEVRVSRLGALALISEDAGTIAPAARRRSVVMQLG